MAQSVHGDRICDVRLFGIHYAGAMHTATGEIKIVMAPTATTPIALTAIPNNIGVAVSSERLLEFEPIIAGIVHAKE